MQVICHMLVGKRMYAQNARISINDAERRTAIATNGYTEGWGYFLTLCSALDARPSSTHALELHDWAEQLLCVPEMRQAIREEHAASHNGGVVVHVPIWPSSLDFHRVLTLSTFMRAHTDFFEAVLTIERNAAAMEYARRMLNQEREAALAVAQVAGVPERQVTIPVHYVPRLQCSTRETIVPGQTRQSADRMYRRLERWLRCAADAEPYLQVVMPWLLAELRAQFRRAMLHVFT